MLASKVLKKGPGLPIVFLHGFLGTAADWESVCSYLPPSYCIGFDLPGHGQSPFTEEVDIPLPRFHLVGYSMGGRIALALAAKHPEKIASLTLMSVHPGLHSDEEKKNREVTDRYWADLLLQLPIDKFLLDWYSQPIFKPFVPDLSMRKNQNVSELAKALIHYSLSKQPYYPIEGVLVGERDEKFRKLYEHPVLIANAGHMVHLENPQAVALEIQRKWQ
jgi:2-succinyl-6-hydroxy-2,4-cyclohexadiene-1-carboxylate synthase